MSGKTALEASGPGSGQGKEVIAAGAGAEGPRPWPRTESAPSANSLFSEPRALEPPVSLPHTYPGESVSLRLIQRRARAWERGSGGCPPWLFPSPLNPCPPPPARSWLRFPGPDGVPAHLNAADWLPHAVTSWRAAAGARPSGAALGREIQNREMGGERCARPRPSHLGISSERDAGVARRLGQSDHNRRNARKLTGPRSLGGGAAAAGAQGTCGRALRLWGICATVVIPPPRTCRGVETSQLAPQLIQRVGMRRCRAPAVCW